MELRDYMLKVLAHGWHIIPLRDNKKEPNLPKGHGFLSEAPNKAQYRKWAEHNKFGNYGIITGTISGITVIDVDYPEGFKLLDELGIDLNGIETPQVLTPNGRHLYFRYSPRVRTGVGVMGKGIDVRNNGAYVVGPGSVVKGEQYVWSEVYDADTPLADVPEWLEHSRKESTGVEWKMTRMLGEGERNNKLASLAGALVVRELPAPLVLEVLMKINEKWCKSPLTREEVENIARSVERYRVEEKLHTNQ